MTPSKPSTSGGPARPTSSSSPQGGGRLKLLRQRLAALLFGERILCDTCKYDYGAACTRPERPNATRCPDYERG
jgi:hypothetical protein